MKNKKLLIALISAAAVVVVTVAVVLIVIGVKNKRPVPTEDPIKPAPITETLAKPQNLVVKDGTLFWDAVEHATSYIVYVGDKEYVADTNNYALGEITGKVKLAVKAKGDGYIDSVKSVEIVYVATVDEADVQKSNATLTAFMEANGVTATEEEINALGTKLYKAGLESVNVDDLCVSLQGVIDGLAKIGKMGDKPESSVIILGAIEEFAKIDVAEYSLVEGSRIFGSFFLSKKADALEVALEPEPEPEPELSPLRHRALPDIGEMETSYYSDVELIYALRRASDVLDHIDARSIQNVAYVLAYFRLYGEQIKSLIKAFEDKSLVDDALYNDLAALKNAIVSSLVNTMPSKADFDLLLETLENFFNALRPLSLKDLITFDGAKVALINIYSANHYIVSFLDSISDSDVKSLLGNVQSLVKSLNDGVVAEIKTSIAYFTDPEFSPEILVQAAEEIAMAQVGLLVEKYPIYAQLMAIPVPQNPGEVGGYILAVLEALDADEYMTLSAEVIASLQGYLMNLVPDMFLDPFNSKDDMVDFLVDCHFENALVFDKEAFYAQLDEIDLVALVKGEITIEEVLATFDWPSYFSIDYEVMWEGVHYALDMHMPELGHFINILLEGDFAMIMVELGIEGLEDELGTKEALTLEEATAFVNHVKELLGFVDGSNPALEFVIGVLGEYEAYAQENFPIVLRLPEVIGFVQQIKSLSEDPVAAAAGTLMPQEQPLDIDLISVYKAYTLVTNRYAKFLSAYKAPYAEGLTINYESLAETAFDGLGYYFFGTNMFYYKGFLKTGFSMLSKAAGVYGAAEELLNACVGYAKDVYAVITPEAILSGEVIDDVLAQLLVAANGVQDPYNNLRSLLGLTEFKALLNLVYDYEIAIGYNEVYVNKDRSDFEEAMVVWEKYAETIDSLVAALPEKVEGLQAFYEQQKVLFAPIVEFLTEQLLPAYLEANIGEKADALEAFLLAEETKQAIEALYDSEILLQMGEALNAIYQFVPNLGETDYVEGMQKICDDIEEEFAKWNDPESAVYAGRVAMIMTYAEKIIPLDEMLQTVIKDVLQLEATINNPDAVLAAFNGDLADAQAAIEAYFNSSEYADLIDMINEAFGIEMYEVKTDEEPLATLLAYQMDEDTWAEVRTALGIKEIIKLNLGGLEFQIDKEVLMALSLYDALELVNSFTQLLQNDLVASAFVSAGMAPEMVAALKMINLSFLFPMLEGFGLDETLKAYTVEQLVTGEMFVSIFNDLLAANFTIDPEHPELGEIEMKFFAFVQVLTNMAVNPADENWADKVAELPEVWQPFFVIDPSDPVAAQAILTALSSLQDLTLEEFVQDYVVAPGKEVINKLIVERLLPMLETLVPFEFIEPISNFLTDEEKEYLADWDYEALIQCFYDRLDALVLSELFDSYVYERIDHAYHSFPYDEFYEDIVDGLLVALQQAMGGELEPEIPEP